MSEDEFCPEQWRTTCEAVSQAAHKGCGMSETMHARNMHALLQPHLRNIHDKHKAQAITIAKSHGYLTTEELAEDQRWNAEHGLCNHGIELGHCPVGCE